MCKNSTVAEVPTLTPRETRASTKAKRNKNSASNKPPNDVISDSILDEVFSGYKLVLSDEQSNYSSFNTVPITINKNRSNMNVLQNFSSSKIVGTLTSGALQSVVLRRPEKWLFVSRPSTSLDQIYEFFSSTFKLYKEDIFASKILPKHRDLSTVSFPSFKVGCAEVHFNYILCREKWPVGVLVKGFVKNKLLFAKSKVSYLVASNLSNLPAVPSFFPISNNIPSKSLTFPFPEDPFSQVLSLAANKITNTETLLQPQLTGTMVQMSFILAKQI